MIRPQPVVLGAGKGGFHGTPDGVRKAIAVGG